MSTNPNKTKVQIRVTEEERDYVESIAGAMDKHPSLRAYASALSKYYGPKLTGRTPTDKALLDKAIYRLGLLMLSDLAILAEHKPLLPTPYITQASWYKRSFDAHTELLPDAVSDKLSAVNDRLPTRDKHNLKVIMESIKFDNDLYNATGITTPYTEDGYIDIDELDRQLGERDMQLILNEHDELCTVEFVDDDAIEATQPHDPTDA